MHDPLTVAFEIKKPWKRKPDRWFPEGYRESWVTIWHKDPEWGGSDDSCGWFVPPLTAKEKAYVKRLVETPEDNLKYWFPGDDDYDVKYKLTRIFRLCKKVNRPWYRHPRWHIWHWCIQIHFIGKLKRYLFSRCEKCGKRFPWGYSPTAHGFGGHGPRWFRGEKGVYHHECASSGTPKEGARWRRST